MEVLIHSPTNACFPPSSPSYVSFLCTDQLGEIPPQKSAAHMQRRCLYWPVSTACCEICPEHSPVSCWFTDSAQSYPVLLTSAVPARAERVTRSPPAAAGHSTCPCPVHPDTNNLDSQKSNLEACFLRYFFGSTLRYQSIQYHYWNVLPILNVSGQFKATDGFTEFQQVIFFQSKPHQV